MLVPWLASAHDPHLVKVEVVILFGVSEFTHHISVSKDIGSNKSKSDFGVALGLSWGDWEHLETLSAQQVVSQEGGGDTPLGTYEH